MHDLVHVSTSRQSTPSNDGPLWSGSSQIGESNCRDPIECTRTLLVRVLSGSSGDAVEAIAGLLSIARLPPGQDLGAGYGVATAARQRWLPGH